MNKMFCSRPSKLGSKITSHASLILEKVNTGFMEYLHVSNIIFALLPGEKSTGPGEFFFFYISPLKFLNSVLIPGAKQDDHWGTWTGCMCFFVGFNWCSKRTN